MTLIPLSELRLKPVACRLAMTMPTIVLFGPLLLLSQYLDFSLISFSWLSLLLVGLALSLELLRSSLQGQRRGIVPTHKQELTLLLRELARSTSDLWIVVDDHHTIREVSANLCTISGYKAEDLLGGPCSRLLIAATGLLLDDPESTGSKGSSPSPGASQAQLLQKDGCLQAMSICQHNLHLRSSGRLHILSMQREAPLLTHASPTHALPRRAHDSELLASSCDAVHVFSGEGALVSANRMGQTYFPLAPTANLSEWLALWPSNEQAAANAAFVSAASGKSARFAGTTTSPTGGELYWDVVAFPAPSDHEAETPPIALVARDITHYQQARMRVAEQAASIQTLVDNVVDAILTIDTSGVILSWNLAAEQIFGYKASEALSQDLSLILPHAHATRYATGLATALRNDQGRMHRIPLGVEGRRRDGRAVPIEFVINEASFNGQAAFVCVLRDLSERKQVEEEQVARLAAESANYAKSQFLANMSHEIRTPLGIILGYARMLSGSKVSEDSRMEYANTILRNGNNLLALLNDVLDLSKVESGHLAIERSTVDLPSLITDLSREIKTRAHEKGLDLRVSYRSHIPQTIVSDPTRLRQVLLNVLCNAVKFTSSGHIALAVAYRAATAERGGCLLFYISDSGCGIPDNCHDRIFEPFSQADESINRKYGGTGLGLSLSRRLARLLGGDLELVRSAPDWGSEFLFTTDPGLCPVEDDVILIDPLTQASRQHPVPAVWAPNSLLQNAEILVVEDFEDNQALIKLYLEAAGAQLAFAANGVEALAAVEQQRFDLILMDIQMPEMNGYLATQELRKRGLQIPIVALTAHAMAGERQRCLEGGFSAYLSKPLAPDDLLATMRRLLPGTASAANRIDAKGRPLRLGAKPLGARRQEAAQDFLGRLPLRLASMRVMTLQADWQTLSSVIHQIHNAAAHHGLPAISKQAHRITQALQGTPQSATVSKLLSELDAVCQDSKTLSP